MRKTVQRLRGSVGWWLVAVETPLALKAWRRAAFYWDEALSPTPTAQTPIQLSGARVFLN